MIFRLSQEIIIQKETIKLVSVELDGAFFGERFPRRQMLNAE